MSLELRTTFCAHWNRSGMNGTDKCGFKALGQKRIALRCRICVIAATSMDVGAPEKSWLTFGTPVGAGKQTCLHQKAARGECEFRTRRSALRTASRGRTASTSKKM